MVVVDCDGVVIVFFVKILEVIVKLECIKVFEVDFDVDVVNGM